MMFNKILDLQINQFSMKYMLELMESILKHYSKCLYQQGNKFLELIIKKIDDLVRIVQVN